MPNLKRRLRKLEKMAAERILEDPCDRVIVHDENGTHEYDNSEAALAAHPLLGDPGNYISVFVPVEDE